jgi:ligand-binding sensor domain-containing protein/two-component sensor histidine kinase
VKRSFIILIAFLLSAWNHFTRAQQINIWKYNIEDGLVNNDILNIYQDSRGFMWLSTRGGLSRYDGSRFTNFTTENGLTNDMINDIYEISPQEFIIAQNSNGPRLLKNDRISALPGGNNITINKFYRIGNRLVGATDSHGVVEWKQSGFSQLNPSYKESISYISAINDSSWLLVFLPFSFRFTSSFLRHWESSHLNQSTAVFTDSHHRTWLGTVQGLKLIETARKTSEKITFLPLPVSFNIPLLKEAYIEDIMEDSQGNTWVGTINGLVRVDKYGISKIYRQQDGLPASQITCIREDREKNIWVGTPLGLAKISLSNEIKTFRLDLGHAHDGTLGMIPTGESTWRIFDGKKIRQLDLNTGTLSNDQKSNLIYRWMVRLNKDEFLLDYGGKADIFQTGKEKPESVPWPDKIMDPVIRKNAGAFLAAVGDTIFTIANGTIVDTLKTGVISAIHHLLIDRNNIIWAGSWDHGMMKISSAENKASKASRILDTIIYRLPDPHIRTLFQNSKNEIWIGTRYKGVVRLVELSAGKYEIQNYGTREGLSADYALTITEDSLGNMWVGTTQGIDKLIPENNHYRVFNFGKVNKMFSKVYDIKFSGSNSLHVTSYPAMLNVRDMQQDTLPPPDVYITKVSAGPVDTSLFTNEILHLPANKAQIYFEFSSPQFINEDFTKYSYRLLGYGDTSWKLSGKARNVNFASLKPGSYTFEIRARGFNDQWGNTASYRFIVNTPFWQKAWFIALIVAAVAFLVFVLYRYRVRQLIHVQKVRNRIANDLHDEIGSNLTNINILSMLSKKNLAQPQKAGDFLKRISDEVSSSSQALDDIIWSVNTSHDTLEETVARMRRYAAELFDAANISYELYLDPDFEARKIGMELRRDLYLLYKEAVNNISKHARATQVSIQVAIERNQLLLTVNDNGKGFDTGQQTERHGLEGMKERTKKWKGKFILESNAGRGTRLQVSLPLAK